jgi:hypothetical protein
MVNQYPQVPNRKLALPIAEQVSVLTSRIPSLTGAKQPTLIKINF